MQAAHAKNRWIDCTPSDWTPALASELIQLLQGDDQFLIDAACETRAEDSEAQLALLGAGIAAVERVLSQSSSTGSSPFSLLHTAASQQHDGDARLKACEELQRLVEQDGYVKQSFQQRQQLLLLQDMTKTWKEIYQSASVHVTEQSNDADLGSSSVTESTQSNDDEHDVEDSWQFEEEEANDQEMQPEDAVPPLKQTRDTANFVLPLPTFLDAPVDAFAFQAAAAGDMGTLKRILDRHATDLSTKRLAIIDTIPLFCEVDDYLDLLPRYDARSSQAGYQGQGHPWREAEEDVRADAVMRAVLKVNTPIEEPFSKERLAEWYKSRVIRIDTETGQIESSLSLVQQGAAQDLPGLDALGEQLSLLSRLIYDRSSGGTGPNNRGLLEDWTLQRWQSSSEEEIVDAYLSGSTEETIASDVRTRLLPYLYVLESQRERTGRPDPELHERMLYDWMLRKASSREAHSLGLLARLFELSKPNLPVNQRIIKSNSVLAQLALACCYGNQTANASTVQNMLRIFECLPSFEEQTQEDLTVAVGSAQTLLAAVQSLPVGMTSQYNPKLPQLLFGLIRTWSTSALSRALDTLDLHLEASEIFARWSSPVALVFFITLSDDEKMQRLWADRLAKTSAAAVTSTTHQNRIGQDFQDEDEWISLLDDLCRLGGKGVYSDADPKPAFARLNQKEITKIFFAGLLSSAKFDLAKSLFTPSSGERPLDTSAEVALVLAASREFYDNAETGNLHFGNMKLAFECLAVAPNTPEIRRERDFIEATSRLASFNVLNTAGEPLTPLEIRLTPDKLDLVSQLLSSNSTAYQHPDVILELVAKLGFKGDHLAETRVLSMLANAALQNNDAKRAGDVCDRTIKTVETIKRSRDADKAVQASELAWRTCFQFGQSSLQVPSKRKQEYLGHALLLCPPEQMQEVLTIWQMVDRTAAVKGSKDPGDHQNVISPTTSSSLSLPFGLSSRPSTPGTISIPSSAESAARAALSVGKAASTYLPFRTTSAEQSRERSQSPRSAAQSIGPNTIPSGARSEQSPARDSHVRAALENRFKAGVGWLLGADED